MRKFACGICLVFAGALFAGCAPQDSLFPLFFQHRQCVRESAPNGSCKVEQSILSPATVLSATTDKLRKFALQYAEDKEAFSETFAFQRKKRIPVGTASLDKINAQTILRLWKSACRRLEISVVRDRWWAENRYCRSTPARLLCLAADGESFREEQAATKQALCRAKCA
jgi:hypothetical protein